MGGEGLQTHHGTSRWLGIHSFSTCLLSAYYVPGAVSHAVEVMEASSDLLEEAGTHH